MPTPKRPVNKKKSFFSRLKPTTKKAKILTTVAAFAVIGGGVMVFRSFAATGLDYDGGVLNWNWEGNSKYSWNMRSNGSFCVDALGFNLNSSVGASTHFSITLYEYKWVNQKDGSRIGGAGKAVRTARNYVFSTDLNRTKYDRICWHNLNTSVQYIVGFDPYPTRTLGADRIFGRLNFKAYGYDVGSVEGQLKPTSTSGPGKSPQANTPAPAPNPQPSK